MGIASAPNLRDIGGLSLPDRARIRTGLVYRSSALNRLAGDDAIAFARLGIRSVHDLRTATERAAQPDRLPPGCEYVVADVIADQPPGGSAEWAALLGSPKAARARLADGGARAMWTQQYREFVVFDSARAAYGRLLRSIASETSRPVVFHCSTGKDRTGWAAAVLLLLLGAGHDQVVDDFTRSNLHVGPMFEPILEEFAGRGGDPELLWPIVGVFPEYLEAGLDEVQRAFGGLDGYLEDGLGIDAETKAAIRDALIEREAPSAERS